MVGITGRYVLREVIPPFCLAQVVLTFLLMLDPIGKHAEELIGVGVDGSDVVGILVTLMPYAIGITLPMALLVGVLIGLGRLSGDREIVALQACGISISRILSPLLVLATAVAAVDCYVLATMVPSANQHFREIVFRVSANRAEGQVKPRGFEVDRFPRVVLYVREVAADGWRDVFLADVERPGQPDVYVADWGRFTVDPERRTVSVALRQGQRHRVDPAEPRRYEVHDFDELTIRLDASALFPDGGPAREVNELSVGELREEIVAMREAGVSPHPPIMALHEKFSIPLACFVFVLLAVGLGVSSRKEGRLASFALGIAVILTYYVVMYLGTAMAKGQWLSPHLVRWIPNVVLGLAGIVLVRWRLGTIERRTLPWLTSRPRPTETPASEQPGNPQAVVGVSPAAGWGISLLDRYVTRIYVHWMALAFVGLLGLSYVITFLDLADKLFKEETTLLKLLTYFWYATPQYVFYVLPIAALVATLVTIGVLTRTSELTVMKACGISLCSASACCGAPSCSRSARACSRSRTGWRRRSTGRYVPGRRRRSARRIGHGSSARRATSTTISASTATETRWKDSPSTSSTAVPGRWRAGPTPPMPRSRTTSGRGTTCGHGTSRRRRAPPRPTSTPASGRCPPWPRRRCSPPNCRKRSS